MPLSKFKEIVAELDFAKDIALVGAGEPFLFNDFFDMVDFCKKRNKITSTITNGDLLNDDVCKKIIDSGMDVISISLDAATNKTFNKIRPGGNFDVVLSNIKRLIEYKKRYKSNIKIAIGTIMLKENFDELLDIAGLAIQLDIPISFFNLVSFGYQMATLENSLTAMNSKKVNLMLSKLKNRLDKNQIKNFIQKPEKNLRWKKCTRPWDAAFINHEGELLFCCSATKKISFGEIIGNRFPDLWNNDRFVETRKRLLYGPEPDCCVNCPNL